ncbi:alpha/beta hydrolase [Subsaximicrobium wynnwilliamsii]|uniref:Alpha/beta hydrolase n=1 Tax=Subsaximicrobium wynnwilliamsii TaxID=291179 RepID=A0A5C6ZKI8_9FLAO|nr:alpha/beta hydrolase [Subsaximicrobium wynnwilliamsii]TXD84719.1 alpha/beta hydrolase [Subsaximicrobium wynnwilliamsii]TXD90389.1 alpha/beta hydrolase [Subsaximicrobium wynnwilliamsii]TXE04865.1 alpha/beta hydrolase [Subsaximicrobium wynnwilliamsii]
MEPGIIHVYLMPGMAANPRIFEFIKLPKDQFEMHWLEWMLPDKNETLQSYAKRMINKIEHHNVVLLGVSFGGILVQEMSKHMQLRKLFVVSSVKSKHELPKRMKLMKFTKAYKILPTQLVGNIDLLAKYAFGETITKRIELYKKYLSVSDKHYLDWAIEHVIEWEQDAPNEDAIYIHGDKDIIFPNSCGGKCIVVKGGTHIMVITKFKWFNENLPKLILQDA